MLINYINSIFYIPLFFLTLFFFQVVMIVANRLGTKIYRAALLWFCKSVLWGLKLAGTKFSVHGKIPALSSGKNFIIVSNHQGMYDIPFIITVFAKFLPVFIAKRELARFVPAVSPALRGMRACLIDRKDPRNATFTIKNFAKRLVESKSRVKTCVIFPEGTRAKDGALKPFKLTGLKILAEAMEDSIIIPIAVDGSWELTQYSLWPIQRGTNVSISILDPVCATDALTGKVDLAKLIGDKLKEVRAAAPNVSSKKFFHM